LLRWADWFDVKEGEASIFRSENGSYKLLARIQIPHRRGCRAAITRGDRA
jgi:hypothetical protein